jgi:Ca-activated chloride channel homolog
MSDRLALVYLVDDSASVSNEGRAAARNYVDRSVKTRRPQDDFAVVGFAQSATVWRSFGSNEALGHWTPLQENRGTDLRKALQFAASILPRDRRGKIVLLTDGNDTGAGAEATIADLRRSSVEVLAVPVENPDRPETLVESVSLPRNIAGGEPFDLAAAIRSTRAQKATVKLYENQFLLQERPADLVAGRNLVRFENLTSEGSQYEIEVQPAEDTFAENNLAKAVAQIRGQPKILLVDPEENRMEPLARVLRAERFQVEVRTPQGFPRSIDDLDRFDLVLVSDVPALLFSQQQMDLLRTWVRDFGGGFVLTGGENSFGIGGYYRTPVEQLLPVRMEHDDRQETPSVALLVILDRSGSMAAQVQGKTKITLANQGAVLALDVLKENDYFGVYAVDTKVHQIVPLGRVQDRQNVQQQILGIESAGGGIYIYTSLLEASKAMRDINAQIKHVILFSDSADAEEKFAGEMGDGAEGSGSALDLASMMLTSRVTTSVVALGYESDKDTPFLKLLAERGNGRFYLTNDPLNLPQIFTTETMKVAQSSLIEEPFVPQPARESKVTEGIDWTQAPLLLGYNSTKPKPTAEVLLSTENGEPLLATWRFGLGQTAAFTSDVKSRWASEWLGWPGYGKLWTQVVRALMRRSDRGLLQVRTEERDNRLQVSVDAVRPDGSYANELPITLISADPEGQTETVTAGQTGPGRYVADVALPERGVRLLSVSTPNNPPVTLSYARSYPAEFIETRTNHEALERLVGKESLGVSADKLFSAGPAVGGQRRDLAPWLLTLAALLLPLDIFLRRRAG